MPPEQFSSTETLENFKDLIQSLYTRCAETSPNFGVTLETFERALAKAVRKYLFADEATPTAAEVEQFLNELNLNDLFMAIACSNGSERAWWEFDQHHRTYLERVARHLASSEMNASEVVDSVYVELYGTKIVDGVRQSKFASYTGKGSLRGWLRTIVWHALVDLHRASHDEVSLDEMTENVGEGYAQSTFLNSSNGGENEMLDEIVSERYRKVTFNALETSFSRLDDHEKLLLLYYHVESMKLREIARIVEVPASPLRNWFQRRSVQRENAPNTRVHESTVMRWLEKTYEKVLRTFRAELTRTAGLKETEIELCMTVAAQDLVHGDIRRHLSVTAA
jgi:RNA polymerase sigma-70 factor